eukprot:513760-Amphidinium_carterae.1
MAGRGYSVADMIDVFLGNQYHSCNVFHLDSVNVAEALLVDACHADNVCSLGMLFMAGVFVDSDIYSGNEFHPVNGSMNDAFLGNEYHSGNEFHPVIDWPNEHSLQRDIAFTPFWNQAGHRTDWYIVLADVLKVATFDEAGGVLAPADFWLYLLRSIALGRFTWSTSDTALVADLEHLLVAQQSHGAALHQACVMVITRIVCTFGDVG